MKRASFALLCLLVLVPLVGFAPLPEQISVSLTAENCGIEVVKTEQDQFSYEYLGIEDTSIFSVTIAESSGKIHIEAKGPGAWKGNYPIQTGPEYRNTVRIYVPDQVYSAFAITCTQAPIRLPDLQARVQLTGFRSSVTVIDEQLTRGAWIINNNTGSVRIEADTISSEIYVSNRGSAELCFRKPPVDLALYLIDCSGSVEVPDGWARKTVFGADTPGIWIQNQGSTRVIAGAPNSA